MRSKLLILIIAAALGFPMHGFTGCFAQDKRPDTPMTGVFDLQTVFGEEGLEQEYLLVSPRSFWVDYNNIVYILDENRIKVFTPDGREKAIIGGPGQGPGEFMPIGSGSVSVGPTGYIAAKTLRWYNIYRPDYTYLTTFGEKELNQIPTGGMGKGPGDRIILLNEEELIEYESNSERKNDKVEQTTRLVYHKNGGKRTVTEMKESLVPFTGGSISPALNYLYWEVTPDNKVVYTRAGFDEESAGGEKRYIVHIHDLTNGETASIGNRFEPVKRPDQKTMEEMALNASEGMSGQRGSGRGAISRAGSERLEQLLKERDKRQEQMRKETEAFYNELSEKDFEGVYNLLIDGATVFVYTHKKLREDKMPNDSNEFLVDIFDIDSGRYLHSAYLPRFGMIRNGYAYRIKRGGRDGFPSAEIYTLDPKIYGR
ncbi:hypothetical protein ACFL6L_04095 [candidate division KSB1 bacterium]